MKAPSAATIHEANQRQGAMSADIRCLDVSMRLHGPAFPVATTPGNNLWLHRAIEAAHREAVLVVSPMPHGARRDGSDRDGSGYEFGYWGELMTAAAQRRGIRGLLIDGHVRDRDAIIENGFPVFCRGVSLRGTSKDPSSPGALGGAVEIGGVSISAGDLVVGDADGVVVVAASEASIVMQRARRRASAERESLRRIRGGESTLRVLGLEA